MHKIQLLSPPPLLKKTPHQRELPHFKLRKITEEIQLKLAFKHALSVIVVLNKRSQYVCSCPRCNDLVSHHSQL